MSRYIDANKLIERLMHNPDFLTAPKHSKDGIIDEIVYQPTADVSEECCNLLLKVRELTEKNQILQQAYECADAARREISSRCDELTEENAKLAHSCTELAQRLHEANEENISVCLKNFDLICENDRIVADTVRTMQSMIKEECIKGGIYPAFVARTIDNVTKEMLEEK